VYSQRKHTLSKKQLATLSKWAAQPKADEGLSDRYRELWDRLNQYVMERGGQVTSVRYANPIRLEVPLESPLADKLRGLGHDPIFLERTTRLGGVAAPDYHARWRKGVVSTGYGVTTVDVYEIRLPK
jgi:hypothetical protein